MSYIDFISDPDAVDEILSMAEFEIKPDSRKQLEAIAYIVFNAIRGESTLLGLGTGAGKTFIALTAMKILRGIGVIGKKTLFLLPNTNATTNIVKEVVKFYPELKVFNLRPAHGMMCFTEEYDIIVSTYATLFQSSSLLKSDGKGSVGGNLLLLRAAADYIVADEVHNCAGQDSQRFVGIDQIVNGVNRTDEKKLILAMSGTLVTADKRLDNIWAPMKLVDGGTSLGRRYIDFVEDTRLFKQTVIQIGKPGKGWRPTTKKYTAKSGTKAYVERAISEYFINYDLEKKERSGGMSIRKINIDMSFKVQYRHMERREVYTSQSSMESKSIVLQQLMQLNSGFMYVKEHGVNANSFCYRDSNKAIYLETHIREWLSETEGKVLIFHNFVECGNLIDTACRNAGVEALRMDSSMGQQEKLEMREDFVSSNTCRILILPYRIGAESLNFTKTGEGIVVQGIVCFDAIFEETLFFQALGRADRLGQKRKTWCKFLSGGNEENKWFDEVISNLSYSLET